MKTYEYLQTNKIKNQYRIKFINTNRVIKLEETEEFVTIGITKKTTEKIKTLLNKFYTKKIIFKTIEDSELSQWIAKNYDKKNDSVENYSTQDDNDLSRMLMDSPGVNILNLICLDALKKDASDVHIESEKDKATVRYRINGTMEQAMNISYEYFKTISTRIKVLAKLNIMENRLPQDGRITVTQDSRQIDLRISIIPTRWGESIVLRILGKEIKKQSLNNLGFSKKQQQQIEQLIHTPHGLILVTGPTGSGKTTTLNTIINQLKSSETKIITIEDPVEYEIKGITQIQINEAIGLTFEEVLKRVLRHDPNIIMVGEIRDKITAELAVRASLTGHLVLSTLHTNDCLSSIERLKDLGIENYMISAVLKGIISQRLIKQKDKETRTIVSETLILDDTIRHFINEDYQKEQIEKYLKETNFESIKIDSINKIKQQIIAKQDLEKEIEI